MALTDHVAAALRRSEHRIVITGAGGWLGRATLDLLREALGGAFAERVHCFGSKRAELHLPAGCVIEQRPLGEIGSLPTRPTMLLHLAFLTKDRAETMPEADYCAANRAIRQMVVDALDPIGVEAVFVASSGAAGRADDPSASPAMRLYGKLKREDEDAFARRADARGTSATIARIFNISGPHGNKLQSYALSSFILDGLAVNPIAVRADHEVRRGYVAIRELMSLVFALLIERRKGVTRFESGGEDIELGALATLIGSRLGSIVERPAVRDGNSDIYLGDARAYRLLLARNAIEPVSLSIQIDEMIAALRRG